MSNIDALSAELARSELAKVGGALGSNGQSTEKVGLPIPDNNPGTGTLLHPDQNQLLPPYHHH